uniref:Uncharacterized protein n=1 Tax=Siphoviridae sp. ct3lF2 TaxID=2825324 RepID=A0A8S5PPP0_9CAUD|nr:MAG TPA: hypothetical protein [Siphoviridae sp. ct3lF2]
MNYFGLMFSFFLPGAVLGCMAALAAVQALEEHERRRAQARRMRQRPLYIENLKEGRHETA